MHAQIPENHWQCECSKSDDPGTNARNTLPVYFPESLCERGLSVIGIQMNKYKIKELNGISRCLDKLSYEWSIIIGILT